MIQIKVSHSGANKLELLSYHCQMMVGVVAQFKSLYAVACKQLVNIGILNNGNWGA